MTFLIAKVFIKIQSNYPKRDGGIAARKRIRDKKLEYTFQTFIYL